MSRCIGSSRPAAWQFDADAVWLHSDPAVSCVAIAEERGLDISHDPLLWQRLAFPDPQPQSERDVFFCHGVSICTRGLRP